MKGRILEAGSERNKCKKNYDFTIRNNETPICFYGGILSKKGYLIKIKKISKYLIRLQIIII